MENASKAIVIAGSILVSLVTITIFYFMFGRVSQLMGGIEPDTQEEALLEFNKGFEAYNKKMMYGTDVISVINKAIDNNRQYKVEYGINSPDKTFMDYYVDIWFTVYERDPDNNKKLNTTKTYKLSEDYIHTNKNNSKIWSLYLSKAAKGDDDDVFRGFKFSAYKCNKVVYTDKSEVSSAHLSAIGRVRRMEFHEIK